MNRRNLEYGIGFVLWLAPVAIVEWLFWPVDGWPRMLVVLFFAVWGIGGFLAIRFLGEFIVELVAPKR